MCIDQPSHTLQTAKAFVDPHLYLDDGSPYTLVLSQGVSNDRPAAVSARPRALDMGSASAWLRVGRPTENEAVE